MHFTMRHKRRGFTNGQPWIWSPALKISWKVENLKKIDFQIIVSGVCHSVQKWFWTHMDLPKCLKNDFKIKKNGNRKFLFGLFSRIISGDRVLLLLFLLSGPEWSPGDVLLLKMKIRPYFLFKLFLQTLRSMYFRKSKTSTPKKCTLISAWKPKNSSKGTKMHFEWCKLVLFSAFGEVFGFRVPSKSDFLGILVLFFRKYIL